jgi:hypothetical protein
MAGLIKRNFVSKNARLPDIATAIDAIRADIPKLANLSYRERLTLAKRIAFAGVAIATNDEPVDVPATDAAIRAIFTGMKYKAAGQAGSRALAALIAHRRQLLGLQEPTLLASAKKNVLTETALLCVTTDLKPQAPGDNVNTSTTILLATGADGRFSVELRLVDGPEPSLPDAEMRKVCFMSLASDIEVAGAGFNLNLRSSHPPHALLKSLSAGNRSGLFRTAA